MSITGIKRRVACFYDDKGEFLGKKGFNKKASLLDYKDRSYNVLQTGVTSTPVKRWYWDLEQYHYNINNPNPLNLSKRVEPILSSEMYNIQLKTKVARDLNDLAKPGFKFDFKTVMIIVAILAVIYALSTGAIDLGGK
jgi:hypothetical protein